MKIAIGNDHVAVLMKREISEYLVSLGHEVINLGTDSTDRCDYLCTGKRWRAPLRRVTLTSV